MLSRFSAVVAAWLVPCALSMCSDKRFDCAQWAKDCHCADNPECARGCRARTRSNLLRLPVLRPSRTIHARLPWQSWNGSARYRAASASTSALTRTQRVWHGPSRASARTTPTSCCGTADKLRHLHARVQGQGARVRGLGALGRVHQEPRLRQPQMPSELWRVQVEVQGDTNSSCSSWAGAGK